jgi:hypothetical protein
MRARCQGHPELFEEVKELVYPIIPLRHYFSGPVAELPRPSHQGIPRTGKGLSAGRIRQKIKRHKKNVAKRV